MLYLYLNVREKTNWNARSHVLRTSSDLRGYDFPDWEADFCPSFSGKEKDILMKVLSDEDLQRFPSTRWFGWTRFPDYAVEKLIIGCMACDVDLEVIKWR